MGMPPLPLKGGVLVSKITLENEQGELTIGEYGSPKLTPYEDLGKAENREHYDMELNILYRQLNATQFSSIQAQLNSHQGENEQEAISYCEDKIRAHDLFNGSLILSDKGCNFIAECNYNPYRYPALLITGLCNGTSLTCGDPQSLPGICRSLVIQIQTLMYSPDEVTPYDRENKHYWTVKSHPIRFQCECDQYSIPSLP